MEYEGEVKKTSVLFEKIWEFLEAGSWLLDPCFWILDPRQKLCAMNMRQCYFLPGALESGLRFIGSACLSRTDRSWLDHVCAPRLKSVYLWTRAESTSKPAE